MELSDIDKQIADLQAKKAQLLDDKKKTALQKVRLAINELNTLGFSYSLTEDKDTTTTRRSGVRADVLKAVRDSDGIKPADIAAMLGIDNVKGKQSVANALSALKKTGAVVVDNGLYKPAPAKGGGAG